MQVHMRHLEPTLSRFDYGLYFIEKVESGALLSLDTPCVVEIARG